MAVALSTENPQHRCSSRAVFHVTLENNLPERSAPISMWLAAGYRWVLVLHHNIVLTRHLFSKQFRKTYGSMGKAMRRASRGYLRLQAMDRVWLKIVNCRLSCYIRILTFVLTFSIAPCNRYARISLLPYISKALNIRIGKAQYLAIIVDVFGNGGNGCLLKLYIALICSSSTGESSN